MLHLADSSRVRSWERGSGGVEFSYALNSKKNQGEATAASTRESA